MTPAKTQGADTAVTTAPDIEVTLLAEEQQVQRDADNLVKALEEANRKREDLAKKWRDVQVTRGKRKAEQHEADAKVRGKLLANAVVAEVRRRFVRQADKARLVAEKLQAERDVLRSPCKVWMRLGVSVSFFSLLLEAEKCVGNRFTRECSGRIVETQGRTARGRHEGEGEAARKCSGG